MKGRDIWIFDLDNTLYPADSNLFAQVSRRMTRFIADRFGLDWDAARRLQKSYFQTYGTTLRGLMTEKRVEAGEFLAYVHDIDLAPLRPDSRLNQALESLPGRKFIHTNASTDYAERVLDRLGLGGAFEAIFDIAEADFRPKPDISGYRRLVHRHGLDPHRAVMVEDIARNLIPAAELGMATAWIDTGSSWSSDGASFGHIHHKVGDLAGWLAEVTAGLRSQEPHAMNGAAR